MDETYKKFEQFNKELSDDEEEVDQIEKFRNANIKPGMFVSGWEDPNEEVFEEINPHGEYVPHQFH